MSVIFLIGRILFALIFIGSGVNGHLMQTEATAGYGESRGLPKAKLLTQISGVLITLGGVGVILGVYLDLAALGLALYALIAAFWVHHFWTDEGMTQVAEMTNFMKNLSIAGGGLMLFALTASGFDPGFTITDGLFSFDPWGG